MSKIFNPNEFYSTYPSKVIARPGYPARATYKSTLMFERYGGLIINEIGSISIYADIGGCFGFGANSMAFQIERYQGKAPRVMVFEISSEFARIGKIIFPHIDFIEEEFNRWSGSVKVFDLITLFDVVEHVVDPESFLRNISTRCKYIMIKTPMETTGEFRGNRAPVDQGEKHPDGHINFFSPKSYEELLNRSNFDIIKSDLIQSIIPRGAEVVLVPENKKKQVKISEVNPLKFFLIDFAYKIPFVSWRWKRKILGGGEHLSLCRSKEFDSKRHVS